MNKSLASFVFSGETLFCLPNESSFVQTNEAKVSSIEPVAPPVLEKPSKYKPNRAFLIITSKLISARLELFEKVMESVNISKTDIDLVEIEQLDKYDFSAPLMGDYIFSFGNHLALIGVPLQLTPYQTLAIKGKKLLLFDNLDVISDNLNGEKKKLWIALQDALK